MHTPININADLLSWTTPNFDYNTFHGKQQTELYDSELEYSFPPAVIVQLTCTMMPKIRQWEVFSLPQAQLLCS